MQHFFTGSNVLLTIFFGSDSSNIMRKDELNALYLEYLGDRNYISVSQIFRGYFRLTKDELDPAKLQRFRLRIKQPIKKHCRLVDPRVNAPQTWDQSAVAVEFSITESGRSYTQYLVSDGDVINGRGQDSQPNWDEILDFDGDTVRLNRPSNTNVADFMMGFGKALILRNTPCQQPRVVEFLLTEMMCTEDEMDYLMTLDPVEKNNFRKLNLYKKSQWIGHLWFWTGLG